MREFTIDRQSAGKRLDRWLAAAAPSLPAGLMQKYLRLKRVKLNGRPAARDARLNEGDLVQLYIEDEFFARPKTADPFYSRIRPKLDILYEDDHLMLVDKRPGLIPHPDASEKVNTLITHVQAYLYQKGQWDPSDRSAFAPALCNRIDRFTGGIEIVARTEEAMRVLSRKIRDREIEKRYLCIVHGRVAPPSGVLDSYLAKNTRRVTVTDAPAPGAQRALTRYATLETAHGLSLMECELLTGRTHQIRAQFAHIRHPLLGDSQYGDPKQNERYHRSFQALYAYRLAFRFTTDAGPLNALNGRVFQVRDVPFVWEYFPD